MTSGDARGRILSLLGHIPERATGGFERTCVHTEPDIRRFSVTYEDAPGEAVRAWLLLPPGDGPFPGVVACHQHNDEYFVGKSEAAGLYGPESAAFARTLCRAGFAVLCPDLPGFEERRPAEYERRANPFLEGGAYERHLFIDCLLHGSTLQALDLACLTRAVDVLCAQPETDGARIGVCGHSLGGQEALWLGWFDARVKAVAASCGAARIRDLQARCINHNYAMYLPGLLDAGLDMDDVLRTLCPKPLLLCQGELDTIFPIDSVRAMAQSARTEYEAQGCPERLKLLFDGGAAHRFTPAMQRAAAEFLAAWL